MLYKRDFALKWAYLYLMHFSSVREYHHKSYISEN